ncbi:MAG: DUF1015 domain-containing protein [Chloroflexi bacterium]|nr:DUF1015 domain-containing protein [Chloroflexota bacterium]
MPVIRPFRALRYAPEVVGDVGRVIAPPYDVISDDERRRLLARDPRNVVRLDFPAPEAGEPDPDDRYRRAARQLGAWRGEGAVRQDPRPAIYAYEQEFAVSGGGAALVRRGFFARVGLEPFGSGIRAHERTLPGPREDRYRLLRATNVNTSPVVAMYEDPSGRVASILEAVAGGPPTVEARDDAGDLHRLWVLVAGTDGRAEALADAASRVPLTIADGHHRYETALRFQAERRAGPADPEADLAGSDFVLMLLLEPVAGPILVLPTHRVLRALGDDGVDRLRRELAGFFDIRADVARGELVATFGPKPRATPGGEGRFGLWTRAGGAVLRARRAAIEGWLPPGGPAVRRLDVSVLGAALEACAGLDAAAVAAGERLTYTKDAAAAIAMVDAGIDGADAAFLLDATPAREIIAVAAEGDVMPQKSTYIHPKAITGLVLNLLEG